MKKKLKPWCNSIGMITNTNQNTNHQPSNIPAAILALNLPSWMPRQVNQTVAKHLRQVARIPAADAEIAREVDSLYPGFGGTDAASKLRHQVRACARETILHAIAASHIEVEDDEVFGGSNTRSLAKYNCAQPPVLGSR